MNEPSMVSSRFIPAAKSTGRHKIAYQGSPAAGAGAGQHEQRDLGGGLEAQPEQHSDREHLPRFGDRFRDAAEEAVHESALVELLLEFGLVVGARAREYHRGMAQGEEEPDRKRSLPAAHQLAGGVVDRRNMIGVKRVPKAQGVGGQPDPKTEGFVAQAEVVRGDVLGRGVPAVEVLGVF
jgi:hypothetical protein